ncbi:MAG: NAD(P)-dependent oxidoreductase [Dehalococcoidia bacterium]
MRKIKIMIGTDHVGRDFTNTLRKKFKNIQIIEAYSNKDIYDLIRDVDVFFGWPDGKAFDISDNLKWIACPGMGIDKIVSYDNIKNSNVIITNAPGTHVTSMADHVIGSMIALTHRFNEAFIDKQNKIWDTNKYSSRISEIANKTVGIYGLGAIGRAVSKRLIGFDTINYAVDPNPYFVPENIKECWGINKLDHLCEISNFLVISAPITNETYNTINKNRLSLMPKGSYVIVISRGEIVDEQALADLIKSTHIYGASIDATAIEPLNETSPLWDLPNVIITPHSSALTPELYEMRRNIFIQNLEKFLKGSKLDNICNKITGV